MWIFLPPQEQFKKLLPWECLDTFLIELDGMDIALVAPTVGAALIHFDTVVYFVISTCLETRTMKAQDRARVLELWIQVARECHKLSNYSSLHGIVTALKAAPIHSLQETWRAVSRWVGVCLLSCTSTSPGSAMLPHCTGRGGEPSTSGGRNGWPARVSQSTGC
ncbi:ral guanine nucleotide dissociation stimulator-like [Nycticebus coucang]|uniref:ral guanine nucleotide dissociation stimulator-like n=1 Tax=Nycticebus coucang TaxID=9470 RepID=UPI00234D19F8|nr:ral guanine nucleotide dissociation stimulator-like [Nycticebus coucang]